jgi:hypothetical protein
MTDAALTIGRLRLDCRVPGDAETADRALGRIRDAVDALLADARAPWLDRLLGEGDDVVFLDRLVVPLDVNAGWDRDRIATAFARALAAGLRGALAGRGAGAGRLRFADRADLLARFLADVATGAPWPPHWRREFAGLAVLPPSAVIRTLLLDGDDGLEALARLTTAGAARVIAALNAADAARVVAGLAARPGGDLREALMVCWRVLQAHGLAGVALDAHGMLRMVLAARADGHRALGGALVLAARALAALPPAIARTGVTAETLIVRVRVHGAEGLLDAAGAAADLAPLAGASADWLAGVVAETVVGKAAGVSGAAMERRHTRFGGALLLLATLARLDLRPLDALPALGAASGRDLVALVVIARALGPGARAVFDDPVLRDVLGLPPRLAVEECPAWARAAGAGGACTLASALGRDTPAGTVKPGDTVITRPSAPALGRLPLGHRALDRALGEAARGLLERFSASLPGFAQSSAAHVRANFLDLTAAVEREGERVVVRLGRPPLDLILRLSGLKRREFAWGGTRVALFDAE